MSQSLDLAGDPHRRLNVMTGEWILVSPHRTKRPWQGKMETLQGDQREEYDPKCYLCPTNTRADGAINPNYSESFAFKNDFSALLDDTSSGTLNFDDLLVASGENGICKVISFSPKHHLTLPELTLSEITKVVELWQSEYQELSGLDWIKYIQIFENKGEVMGCSNPHPHGQIWAQSTPPVEIVKESHKQKEYYATNNRSLLGAYLQLEKEKGERIVFENEDFAVLVPFWAIWPFETMIVSKRHVNSIAHFNSREKISLAETIKVLTTKYDNLFKTSFPYSAGMHQAPVNSGDYPEWHWHMHFYPPLLRSASVKKFMVGYEMLANPQRDITAEYAAARLRDLSNEHYKNEII